LSVEETRFMAAKEASTWTIRTLTPRRVFCVWPGSADGTLDWTASTNGWLLAVRRLAYSVHQVGFFEGGFSRGRALLCGGEGFFSG
jgi:hypothetical protein